MATSDAHDRVRQRIAELLREVMQERFVRYQDLADQSVPHASLTRVLKGETSMLLRSVVAVFDSLGYDLVINLRERK